MRNQKSGVSSQEPGRIFVVSGPSGSGKTTLLDKLFSARSLKPRFARVVSFTTRPKRSGEKNKKAYLFITQQEFRRQLKAKKILEWTRYLGYYYATPKDSVESAFKRGRHVVLCLDLKGARRIKRLYPKNSVTIFIEPPSLCVLKARIESRCAKTRAGEVRQRLELARREVALSRGYDYCLINKNLSEAAKKLKNIVLKEIRR